VSITHTLPLPKKNHTCLFSVFTPAHLENGHLSLHLLSDNTPFTKWKIELPVSVRRYIYFFDKRIPPLCITKHSIANVYSSAPGQQYTLNWASAPAFCTMLNSRRGGLTLLSSRSRAHFSSFTPSGSLLSTFQSLIILAQLPNCTCYLTIHYSPNGKIELPVSVLRDL
jgi:hypothetical protein